MKFFEFRELVENARDIVIEVDLEGLVLYASPRIEAVLGWPLDEFRGEDMFRHVHADDVARLAGVFTSVARSGEGGTGAETYRHRHRDGSWRWLESSGRIFRSDDGALRAVLVTRDVTEKRQAEIEQERFFALSTDLIATFDSGGHFTRVNEAWRTTLGWEPEELLGKRIESILHPDDLQRTLAAIADFVARGDQDHDIENRYRHRDGGYRWLSWRSTGVPELQLAFVLGRDVTEQRRAEEQLRHAQKMEALGRMAGGVAHDFNNYLTIISGYAELLQSDDYSEEERRAMLEDIGGGAERAAQLTRQLLVFSRKQPLETTPLDVAETVRGMDAMIRSLAGDNVDVSIRVEPDLWWIDATCGHIEQAVLNLIANARDAMPRGGPIRIELVNQGPDVALGDRPRGDWVTCRVRDSGRGMAPDVLDRIFEPFFTTKRSEHGTGLGLSLVHGIVNQIGGHIHVDSRRHEGTTFVLSFPKGTSEVGFPARVREETGPRARGERILLVEDDPSVRKLALRVLQREGYDVVAAEKGEEALELSEKSHAPFDLLVTDVMMKRMDGVELAQMLRRRSPGLPVLFVSGYTDDRIPHDLLDGNCRFVAKPFAPEDLRRHTREVLDQPRAPALREVAPRGEAL